ncbi:MAG: hypothetical protein KDI09_06980, partial [Halioglobus sp.]|nr:hypothetical protein [Halioglobus sp.]
MSTHVGGVGSFRRIALPGPVGSRRRACLALALTSLLWVVSATRAETVPAAPTRPPNIIVILLDDAGWRDAGFAGNEFIETPHID